MRTVLPSRATAGPIALAAAVLLAGCVALNTQAADGLQWSIQPERVGAYSDAFWRVAYGNGRLVAVSTKGIHRWNEDGGWSNEAPGCGGLAFGNGNFVAVGCTGPSFASEDGDVWGESENVPPASRVVAYGRDLFVTCASGYVAKSELGRRWDTMPANLDDIPAALAFGKGRWVMSNGLRVRTSINLIDWPLSYVQEPSVAHSIRSVAFGGGLFVAAGEDGQVPEGEVVLTSEDAMTWTVHGYAHNEGPRQALCYGNGLFAGGGPDGTLYTSSDGVSWAVTKLETSSEFEDVVFADGRFAAVARDGTFALSEVIAPSVEEIRFRLKDSFRLPDGAMLLTVEGPYGQSVVVEASADMVDWEQIATDPCDRGEFEGYDEAAAGLPQRFYRAYPAPPEPPPGPLEQWTLADTVLQEGQTLDWKLAYGNGVFVAAGRKNDKTSGSAWYSDDGLAWQPSNSTAPHQNLAFGASRFASWASALPLSTVNGREWTEHDPVGFVVGGQMAFGRRGFICVAPGSTDSSDNDRVWFVSSADGRNWMTNMMPLLPSGIYPMAWAKSVAYAKGRMVFLDSYKIVTSADGEEWDVPVLYAIDPFFIPALDALLYGKGRFVARGRNVHTSEDGATWVNEGYRYQPDVAIYGNGTLLGASWDSSRNLTQMYGSAEGVTWTNVVEIQTSAAPADLLFAEGRFYLVTYGGEVWHSEVVPSHVTEPRVIPELTYRLPDGAMLVTVEAPYGHEVVVEGSEDLETWQEVGRDPCDRGEFEIYHETAPPGTDWFYRARQVEP
ncbi:MAG: hypothetical protein H7A46_11860 [Verrucomicrobiales bacterium]|nr:hypothetical protein [Verrucomicrobiales bacterium]